MTFNLQPVTVPLDGLQVVQAPVLSLVHLAEGAFADKLKNLYGWTKGATLS